MQNNILNGQMNIYGISDALGTLSIEIQLFLFQIDEYIFLSQKIPASNGGYLGARRTIFTSQRCKVGFF